MVLHFKKYVTNFKKSFRTSQIESAPLGLERTECGTFITALAQGGPRRRHIVTIYLRNSLFVHTEKLLVLCVSFMFYVFNETYET